MNVGIGSDCGYFSHLGIWASFLSEPLWNAQVFLKLLNLGFSQSEQHVITGHVKDK